jgi:hypothetical protein
MSLPSLTPATMEAKLSSISSRSAASFVTSLPGADVRVWGCGGVLGKGGSFVVWLGQGWLQPSCSVPVPASAASGSTVRPRPRPRAQATPSSNPPSSTPLSRARSPAMPMASPTSAFFSAGASFTPSPVTATTSPRAWACSTIISLCAGVTRAKTTWRWASAASQAASHCSAGRSSQPRMSSPARTAAGQRLGVSVLWCVSASAPQRVSGHNQGWLRDQPGSRPTAPPAAGAVAPPERQPTRHHSGAAVLQRPVADDADLLRNGARGDGVVACASTGRACQRGCGAGSWHKQGGLLAGARALMAPAF